MQLTKVEEITKENKSLRLSNEDEHQRTVVTFVQFAKEKSFWIKSKFIDLEDVGRIDSVYLELTKEQFFQMREFILSVEVPA